MKRQSILSIALVALMVLSVTVVAVGAVGVASAARNEKPLAKPHVTTAPKNYEQLTGGYMFEWKPVTGAGGYYLEMKITTDGITWDDVSWSGTTTSALWRPYDFLEGSTFMWRIKALVTDGVDSPLDSAWSPWRTFTYVGSTPPEPITASLTVDFKGYSASSRVTGWSVDPTASSGPIVKYELTVKYEDMFGTGPQVDTYTLTGQQEIPTSSAYGPVEMTLTVYDAANNKDSMTKTVTPPVQAYRVTIGAYVFYPSGSQLGIPQGEDVTFVALESGTWGLYNPEWDPTPDDITNGDGWVASTGASVAVHSGLAPTMVNFYKAGSDLTTPDWTAIVWYGYPT